MKNTINPTYLALTEILEAAVCHQPTTGPQNPNHDVVSIPMRAWHSPIFRTASGRTDHVAVIVLLDIINRYLNVNSPHDDEHAIVIDGNYYAADFRVPAKKLEAAILLLQAKGAITLSTTGQKLWAVPCPEVIAQAVLQPRLLHFYQQWQRW